MRPLSITRPKSVWERKNPILLPNQPGFEDETGKVKIGTGATRWNDLPYAANGAAYVVPEETPDIDPVAALVAMLADVALSGKYGDLQGLPTLGSAASRSATDFEAAGRIADAVAGLAKVARTGSYSDLANLPVGEIAMGRPAPGRYLTVHGSSSNTMTLNNISPTGGWCSVWAPTPIDRFGFEVVTAASGGSVTQGLYKVRDDNPALMDKVWTGTYPDGSTTTAGFKEIVLNTALTLPKGRYAVFLVNTGAPTTPAVIRSVTNRAVNEGASQTESLGDRRGGIHPSQLGAPNVIANGWPDTLPVLGGPSSYAPGSYMKAV